jgi:hypothetical protein
LHSERFHEATAERPYHVTTLGRNRHTASGLRRRGLRIVEEPRIGTQLQRQIVDAIIARSAGSSSALRRRFECWRWDDRWIYHDVEHALDHDLSGRSHSFSGGRSLPRRLSGMWTLDLAPNRAIDFAPDCQATSRPFPYRLRAHRELLRLPVSGSLQDD